MQELHMLMKILDPQILEDVQRGEVFFNIRFMLSGDNEHDQRKNLFFSRHRFKDKCCDVIINGGSTDNLVLEMMVTKLKLKR